MMTLVLTHYFFPDNVISSMIFKDYCQENVLKAISVEVWPGNRECHSNKKLPTKTEDFEGAVINRIWRPPFSQHSFLGRIFNSFWMQFFWFVRLLLSPRVKPDVILLGTDPLLAVLLAPWLKRLRPQTKIIHWCFDLYPEAAVADNIVSEKSLTVKWIKALAKRGYKSCDLVVDIGSCMRERLKSYEIGRTVTFTPWAQEEPEGPLPIEESERQVLFGETPLGLLYSGSFGRAHEFYLTLKLARLMRNEAVFAFGVRGSRLAELQKAVNPEDKNIHFAPFAPEDRLRARLSAPDVHIVSLRPEWTGVVVPSKFFGALAVGRPVLFEGDERSSIARWIKEYGVGWVLTHDNLETVREELLKFSGNAKMKAEMFSRCHEIYSLYFSKKIVLDAWDRELKALLSA